jgi:hypothetical protein
MKEPETIREMERQLLERGFSRTVAKRLISQMKTVAPDPEPKDLRSRLADSARRLRAAFNTNAKD